MQPPEILNLMALIIAAPHLPPPLAAVLGVAALALSFYRSRNP